MLLTGSWSHLVSRYAGLDLRMIAEPVAFFFFFCLFQFGSFQQFFDHLLSLKQERQDHHFFFSYIRAYSSHLNSFVKLSRASGRPFFLSRGACRVCARGERAVEREKERERERESRREREREQIVNLNVRCLPRMVCSVAVSHSHRRSCSAALQWTTSYGGGRRTAGCSQIKKAKKATGSATKI